MVVLKEILLQVVRARDPLAARTTATRLLRSYYPLITPSRQNGLASALNNSAERLPSGTHCADPALSFVRYLALNECRCLFINFSYMLHDAPVAEVAILFRFDICCIYNR